MSIKFERPENWDLLSKRERRDVRRRWRKAPETRSAKKAVRKERREKRQEFLSKWVLSPVLPKVQPALLKAIDDGLGGDEAVNDAIDYLKEQADNLADFGFITNVPFVGDVLEGVTDILLDLAEEQLEAEVNKALDDLKAKGLWPE
jgi:hypothetical protein